VEAVKGPLVIRRGQGVTLTKVTVEKQTDKIEFERGR